MGVFSLSVKKDFTHVDDLEKKALQVDFSNWQDMFIITKACLGIFLASF